jgi:YVTN family beta-propeller protein
MRHFRCARRFLRLLAMSRCLQRKLPARAFAYISNEGDGTLSVIDIAINAVVATVPVGALPFGVAVNPTGNFVYVTNVGSNTVSVVDTAPKPCRGPCRAIGPTRRGNRPERAPSLVTTKAATLSR